MLCKSLKHLKVEKIRGQPRLSAQGVSFSIDDELIFLSVSLFK